MDTCKVVDNGVVGGGDQVMELHGCLQGGGQWSSRWGERPGLSERSYMQQREEGTRYSE